MRPGLLLAITMLVFSCAKKRVEEITNFELTAVNSTGHTIELLPFYGGTTRERDRIQILPHSDQSLGKGWGWGIQSIGSGFESRIAGCDSLIVLFDNQFKVTHYGATPINLARRYYLFIDDRNIGYPIHYQGEIVRETKTSRNIHYSYTFTEQDYLYAQ